MNGIKFYSCRMTTSSHEIPLDSNLNSSKHGATDFTKFPLLVTHRTLIIFTIAGSNNCSTLKCFLLLKIFLFFSRMMDFRVEPVKRRGSRSEKSIRVIKLAIVIALHVNAMFAQVRWASETCWQSLVLCYLLLRPFHEFFFRQEKNFFRRNTMWCTENTYRGENISSPKRGVCEGSVTREEINHRTNQTDECCRTVQRVRARSSCSCFQSLAVTLKRGQHTKKSDQKNRCIACRFGCWRFEESFDKLFSSHFGVFSPLPFPAPSWFISLSLSPVSCSPFVDHYNFSCNNKPQNEFKKADDI